MSRIKKRLTNIYSNIVRKHIQSAPFATKVGQHSDDNWNIKVFHVMTFQKNEFGETRHTFSKW